MSLPKGSAEPLIPSRTQSGLVYTLHAVLVEVEVFEKKLKSLNLGTLLAEAEIDIREGRTRGARDFLKEFQKNAKASRGDYQNC